MQQYYLETKKTPATRGTQLMWGVVVLISPVRSSLCMSLYVCQSGLVLDLKSNTSPDLIPDTYFPMKLLKGRLGEDNGDILPLLLASCFTKPTFQRIIYQL